MVAHWVGTHMTGTLSLSETAFAVSTDFPPPHPMMTSASSCSAFAATSAILAFVHSVTESSDPASDSPAESRLAWTRALTLDIPVRLPTANGLSPYCLT